MMKGVAMWCAVAMLVVLVTAIHETAAEDCSPEQLSLCLPAIVDGQDPSSECCGKLKEQQSCFCEYRKVPILKPYLDSNADKVLSACGLATPTC